MIDSKFTGFITVRTTSTRLPEKCLLPFGGETVIGHVIKRAISYGIDPIICTSTDASDDVLEGIANELGVRFFRGSMNNKLKRWYDCAKEFDIESFHTIDADDPFFDGSEMIKSLNILWSGNYDVVCPTELSSSGGASVGYSLSTDIVKRALCGLADDADTEMMWYYLEKIVGIKMVNFPELDNQHSKVRLTLDYEEDYWLLASVVRILGNTPSRTEINQLFINNPDLTRINFFRNDEWKAAQISKKI